MEAKPKSEEVKCLEAAYLAVLRMPEGEVRIRNSFLLDTLRDSLAAELGREEQEVQSEYEFIARNVQAAPAIPTKAPCEHIHKYTNYDHVKCMDCGSVKTDGGWGIASRMWFSSFDEAKFYQKNGRLPERARPPVCEAEDLAGMIEAQSRGSEK